MSDLGRYRKIYARLWRHPGFTNLTDGEKNLVFYLLTGPQTNRLGLFVLSIATAAEDLETLPQTLTKRLRNVCQTLSWHFDSKARVFYIPSWFKWNPPENANVVKGSLKDLNEIPPCGLVDAFTRNTATLPETLRETFIEGLRQRLPNGMPNQDQYQDQYQKQEQKPARPPVDKERIQSKELVSAARQALKLVSINQDVDALVDVVRFHIRTERNLTDIPRLQIVDAVNTVLAERRTQSA